MVPRSCSEHSNSPREPGHQLSLTPTVSAQLLAGDSVRHLGSKLHIADILWGSLALRA